MSRVTKAVTGRNKHRKVLRLAKGYYGARSRLFKTAKQSNIKSLQYAFRDRKNRKRNFRALWIARINAGAREHGMSYSQFMGKVKSNKIELNRKVLADLAMNNPQAFKAIVEKVK